MTVTVRDATGGPERITYSDDSGRFRLVLPAGKYTLKTSLIGFTPQEKQFTVEADKAVEVEVAIAIAARPMMAGGGFGGAPGGPRGTGFQTVETARDDEEAEVAEPVAAAAAPEPIAPPSVTELFSPNELSSDAFVISGNIGRNIAPQMDFEERRERVERALKSGQGDGRIARRGRLTEDDRRRLTRERTSIEQRRAAFQRGRPEGGRGGPETGGFGDGAAQASMPGGGSFGGGFAGGGGPGRFGGGPGGFGGVPDLSGAFWAGAGGPRGGLNRLRGSIRTRYSNDVFDARPYSLSGYQQPKRNYYRENISVSGGGPLPQRLHLGRAMFMVNYEEDRGRQSQVSSTTVPLEPQRAGNFSGIGNVIYDPLTRQPFPNNRIPAERINSAAAGLLRFIPMPNLPGTTLNYQLQQVLPSAQDSVGFRFSRSLSTTSRSNVSFSYNLSSSRSERAQIFPDLLTQVRTRGQNVSAGWTRVFRQRATNDLRLTFNRNRVLTSNNFAGQENIMGGLGIEGVSLEPEDWGVPTISFSNFGRLSDTSPTLRRTNSWRLAENFTYSRRRHTFRVGILGSRTLLATRSNPNPRGSFSFTGQATSGLTAGGSAVSGTGFDFADFLLGLPNSTNIRYGQNNMYFQGLSVGAYAQDDIRLTPRLSVTLGVRYEYLPPLVEKYNHIVNLDVAQWFTGVAAVLPGEGGPYTGHFPRSLVNSDRNNFAPRLGVAWRPTRRRMILRAGYGLFYDNTVWDRIFPAMATQPPFAVTTSRLTSPTRVLTLQQPFPPEPAKTVKNTVAIDRNFVQPYVQNWNFSLQQDFRRGFMIELGYMGTKGTKLYLIRSPNRAAPGSQLTSEDRRIIGNAVGFQYHSSGASSIFHAFQGRVHRRFARGMMISTQYSYGKSIDNASSIGGAGNVVAQDDANLRGERGLSSFDQRHRVEIRWMYEFPFGQRRKFFQEGIGARLLGNWQVSGGATFNSGHPFTPLVGGNRANNSGSGGGTDRADLTGAPIALDHPTVNRYFNTEAFAVPLAGHFGNAGRNVITGPGSRSFNASLAKSFRLAERGPRGEIRLEANNLFNTPVFTGLGTTLNAYNFGRITGARSMRTLQWHARLTF